MSDEQSLQRQNADGITRRDFMRVGGLALGGASLAGVLGAAPASAAASGPRARSVILLWMDGGPPQHETFDPKPEAPAEVRGPFGAVSSSVDGLRIGELMPRMARRMHRLTLIRTLQHTEGSHERANHKVLTGWDPDPELVHPPMSAVVAHQFGNGGLLQTSLALPRTSSSAGLGHGGCFDAFARVEVDNRNRQRLASALPSSVRLAEFGGRLPGDEADRACELSNEPAALRERYGRHAFGENCLQARRLVERGVRFVTVSFSGWDTHSNNFSACQDRLAPAADQALSALLDDLRDRGLLGETLVVWMGEFGRTPKINALAGRDHWPYAGCALLAGAGVPGGQVIGRTDAHGGVPVDRPVNPADLCATIYQKLGIDHCGEFPLPSHQALPILPIGEPLPYL
jgi:hypothetical protein